MLNSQLIQWGQLIKQINTINHARTGEHRYPAFNMDVIAFGSGSDIDIMLLNIKDKLDYYEAKYKK